MFRGTFQIRPWTDKGYPELKTYLRRLGWALASLPKGDRDDIVEETQTHVLDRIEQGQSLSQALAALGSAESYARRFIDEMEISDALASQRQLRMLSVVFTRMHRNMTVAFSFLALMLLALLAIGCAGAAVMKPFDPQHLGLWVGELRLSGEIADAHVRQDF